MENRNVNEMTTNELEDTRITLYKKVEALPQRFPLNGHEFVWQEKMDYKYGTDAEGKLTMEPIPSLRIHSTNRRDIDVYCEIGIDGAVRYYSFSSTSGNNMEEAKKSLDYLETCVKLLSDDFRQMVLRDYNEKLEVLNSLKKEYTTISDEQERRHDEAKAKEKEAEASRRKTLENVGQVWFDYGWRNGVRLTVKDVTEKTIMFNIWSFDTKEGKWNIFDTKRISKHLLGYKPHGFRDTSKVFVCPVGTDDLYSQKYDERPETVSY
jgi:hypothetical protein